MYHSCSYALHWLFTQRANCCVFLGTLQFSWISLYSLSSLTCSLHASVLRSNDKPIALKIVIRSPDSVLVLYALCWSFTQLPNCLCFCGTFHFPWIYLYSLISLTRLFHFVLNIPLICFLPFHVSLLQAKLPKS